MPHFYEVSRPFELWTFLRFNNRMPVYDQVAQFIVECVTGITAEGVKHVRALCPPFQRDFLLALKDDLSEDQVPIAVDAVENLGKRKVITEELVDRTDCPVLNMNHPSIHHDVDVESVHECTRQMSNESGIFRHSEVAITVIIQLFRVKMNE